jgi:hypothetical protein
MIVIRTELNCIQHLLYQIYVGKEEFTIVNWISLTKRLLSIRDRVKEDN